MFIKILIKFNSVQHDLTKKYVAILNKGEIIKIKIQEKKLTFANFSIQKKIGINIKIIKNI